MHPRHSQGDVIDRGEHLKHRHVCGSQCNPFYSNQNYVSLDRGTAQPPICHFLRNGCNRQKKKGEGGKKKISIPTKLVKVPWITAVSIKEYCNEEMSQEWLRGVSTGRVRGEKKEKYNKIQHTHTLIHTNMSETDVGCHARPPTVHNEGHSPFCSGSPTVNTILSHWASFPPPCALPHFFLDPVWGKGVCRTERERER